MSNEAKGKVVYSPAVAKKLLQKGHRIIDIKPSKVRETETYFVFECTNELLEDLMVITLERR